MVPAPAIFLKIRAAAGSLLRTIVPEILLVLPVNTDGSLAPAAQIIEQFGKGADTARQKIFPCPFHYFFSG